MHLTVYHILVQRQILYYNLVLYLLYIYLYYEGHYNIDIQLAETYNTLSLLLDILFPDNILNIRTR